MTPRKPEQNAPGTSAVDIDVVALVRARVRVRFSLTTEEFSRLLVERAAEAGQTGHALEYLHNLQLDDLYLAAACVRRDESAWMEFERRHFGFMRDFARRFLPETEAADLADRVIADLWERGKLARYEGRSALRTWLGAVVAHAALNTARARAREPEADQPTVAAVLERLAQPQTAPDQQQAARLLGSMTSAAIATLPDADKLLLLLYYEQGLTLDQIGPMLGSSKATLSRRLKHVQSVLRATIERLALERCGLTLTAVLDRLDLGRIELDLAALLRTLEPVKRSGGDVV